MSIIGNTWLLPNLYVQNPVDLCLCIGTILIQEKLLSIYNMNVYHPFW